jgi:uncharacterized protein
MSEPGVSLRDRIIEDMKAAMRAKDAARLSTIRMLTAAMKQREVDERIVLTDADVLAIVAKLIKQRRDSIAQFEKAARTDLVDKEAAEVVVLSAYLPRQLSNEEIDAAVAIAVADSGVAGPAAMGKVMGLLKQRLAGQADMTQVSVRVKAKLAS